METKPLLKDETLWDRIHGFSLDAPDAEFPFFKKNSQKKKIGTLILQKSNR